MENKRRFMGFAFRFFIAALCAASAGVYAETAVARITAAEGGAFFVTRGGDDLSFSSVGDAAVDLFSGDIIKTSSGTLLTLHASSGIVVYIAENSAFFLRPADYPSASENPEGEPSAFAFHGELFYGRIRLVSPAEAAPSSVSASSFFVYPSAGSDLGCDILYMPAEEEGGEAFSGVNAVACFSGFATVVRGADSAESSSPVVLQKGEMISADIPANSDARLVVSVDAIDAGKTDTLDFWGIGGREVAALPSDPSGEAAEQSLQERILPEQSERGGLDKQTLKTTAGVMFFGGLLLTGVTMYCVLNDYADNAVVPLAVSSGVLVGGSLVPAIMSLFAD